MLRLSERTSRIEHVPRILYHWRKLPGSIAAAADAKDGIARASGGRRHRPPGATGVAAFAQPHPTLPHRDDPSADAATALAKRDGDRPDARRPGRSSARCLASLFSRTTYPSLSGAARRQRDERSRRPAIVRASTRSRSFRSTSRSTSRARTTSASPHADGELRRLPEQRHGDPDARMARGTRLARRSGTESVRSGLCSSTRTARSSMPASCSGSGVPPITSCAASRPRPTGMQGRSRARARSRRSPGRASRSAAGSSSEAGGFDERFATHYQDVDLCLRLRQLGRRNLYTPRAVVRHDEGATRGDHYDQLDRALLLDAWGETIGRGDPYYSPRLSLAGGDYRPVAA